jgi:hypothetical protein
VVLLFDCGLRTRNAGCLNPGFINKSLLAQYPNARLSIYGFSGNVNLLLKPSRNLEQIEIAINSLLQVPAAKAMSNPIIEAILDAVAVPASAPHALVIVTEATQRLCQMPPVDYDETIEVARKYGIALYPVVMSPLMGQPATKSHVLRPPATPLLKLGPATGGKSFTRVGVFDGELAEILKTVTSHLKSEYVAGYYASPEKTPKVHETEVVMRSQIAVEIESRRSATVH